MSGAGGADSDNGDSGRPKWRRFSPAHGVDAEQWTDELRVAREGGRRHGLVQRAGDRELRGENGRRSR
jgi:hypothetical protein